MLPCRLLLRKGFISLKRPPLDRIYSNMAQTEALLNGGVAIIGRVQPAQVHGDLQYILVGKLSALASTASGYHWDSASL